MYLLYTALFVALVASGSTGSPSSVTVVDLEHESKPVRMAAQAAIGLANRGPSPPSVFGVMGSRDLAWLTELKPEAAQVNVTAHDFLTQALTHWHVIGGNASDAGLIGSWITTCACSDTLPLDFSLLPLFPSATVAYNFSFPSQMEAVQATADSYLADTNGLCFQKYSDLSTGNLVDYIFRERLFTVYLENGCIPFSPEKALLKRVIDASHWPRPIRVYGYNSQHPLFGGDLFEAETDCVNVLGQIATSGTNGLSFWGEGAADAYPESLNPPLKQVPSEALVYNASKVYVAIVYGDMDNIDIASATGADHMRYRAQQCAAHPDTCFPLSWTTSPNLLFLWPDLIQWFYRHAHISNGLDHFVFPPSGTLYSYPAHFPSAEQDAYVVNMNRAGRAMDTFGSVHWEWELRWNAAFDTYYPRFSAEALKRNVTGVRAFFLDSVPWVLPMLRPLKSKTYEFVGGTAAQPESVVAFKNAFNWDGPDKSGGLPLTPQNVSARIQKFPRGTVTYIYTIQTTHIESLFELASILPEWVSLVAYDSLESLARQRDISHGRV